MDIHHSLLDWSKLRRYNFEMDGRVRPFVGKTRPVGDKEPLQQRLERRNGMNMAENEPKHLQLLESNSLTRRDEMILEVATKIFARRGYRNTDVQEIADELGIGKGTIYRAFGTKEELFFATVDYGMVKLNESMRDHKVQAAKTPDSPDNMEQGILTFLSFFDAHPDLIELLIQERSEFKHRESHSYVRHWETNIASHRCDIQSKIEAGKLRNLPVEDLLEVFSGMCYGAIFVNHFARKKINLQQMAKLMTDVLSNGILTDSERERRLTIAHS
jgi:AcrR family transcriptional regulator